MRVRCCWRQRLRGTDRDVISDDGINYWKAPDGQLFTVLISARECFCRCYYYIYHYPPPLRPNFRIRFDVIDARYTCRARFVRPVVYLGLVHTSVSSRDVTQFSDAIFFQPPRASRM